MVVIGIDKGVVGAALILQDRPGEANVTPNRGRVFDTGLIFGRNVGLKSL
jgi:hypothetical protein